MHGSSTLQLRRQTCSPWTDSWATCELLPGWARLPCWQHLFLLSISYWLCYYSCPKFSPYTSLCPVPSFPPASPPRQFMFMGCTYKFFGFSISYTILNHPLSIFNFPRHLPFMILTPCAFSLILPLLPSQLITLQMISLFRILFLFWLLA